MDVEQPNPVSKDESIEVNEVLQMFGGRDTVMKVLVVLAVNIVEKHDHSQETLPASHRVRECIVHVLLTVVDQTRSDMG